MPKKLVLLILLELCGCDETHNSVPEARMDAGNEAAAMPYSASAVSDDPYHLRISRNGIAFWNGVEIGDAALQQYLAGFAKLPGDAGRLSVEFEPGVSRQQHAWIRKRVIDSGLCHQKRCVEARWDVRSRIVY